MKITWSRIFPHSLVFIRVKFNMASKTNSKTGKKNATVSSKRHKLLFFYKFSHFHNIIDLVNFTTGHFDTKPLIVNTVHLLLHISVFSLYITLDYQKKKNITMESMNKNKLNKNVGNGEQTLSHDKLIWTWSRYLTWWAVMLIKIQTHLLISDMHGAH